MNALLVALMLQLPDIAEALVNKLLELLGNPNSTVFLRDDVDEQQGNEASGIGKIKHSVKSVRMVDYIQSYNATLVQDLLSSRHARTHAHTHTRSPSPSPRHPTHHVTALMFACRWGYAHLLPKFFQLVKLQASAATPHRPLHYNRNTRCQESIKTCINLDDAEEAALPITTPFVRQARIMQALS